KARTLFGGNLDIRARSLAITFDCSGSIQISIERWPSKSNRAQCRIVNRSMVSLKGCGLVLRTQRNPFRPLRRLPSSWNSQQHRHRLPLPADAPSTLRDGLIQVNYAHPTVSEKHLTLAVGEASTARG